MGGVGRAINQEMLKNLLCLSPAVRHLNSTPTSSDSAQVNAGNGGDDGGDDTNADGNDTNVYGALSGLPAEARRAGRPTPDLS